MSTPHYLKKLSVSQANWSLSFPHKTFHCTASNTFPPESSLLYLSFELLAPWRLELWPVSPCLSLGCKFSVSQTHNRSRTQCCQLSERFQRYWCKKLLFWFLPEFSKIFLLDLHYSKRRKADTWSYLVHLFL